MRRPPTRRTRLLLWAAPAALIALWVAGEEAWRWWHSPVYRPVDLLSLARIPLDQDSGRTEDLPAAVRGLDGRRVSVQGRMWAARTTGGHIEVQVLDPYFLERRFGPPLVQERVYATLPAGGDFPVYPPEQPVLVSGVFHVGVVRDETDWIMSVYRLDVEQVNPAPPAPPPQARVPAKRLVLLAGYGLAGAVAVADGWRGWRRRRRIMAGLCPVCGYDLRASPGRCPECGSAVARRAGTELRTVKGAAGGNGR